MNDRYGPDLRHSSIFSMFEKLPARSYDFGLKVPGVSVAYGIIDGAADGPSCHSVRAVTRLATSGFPDFVRSNDFPRIIFSAFSMPHGIASVRRSLWVRRFDGVDA